MTSYTTEPQTGTTGQRVSANETPALNSNTYGTTTTTNAYGGTNDTADTTEPYYTQQQDQNATTMDNTAPVAGTTNDVETSTGSKMSNYFKRDMPLLILRISQFITSAIVLGLVSFAIHSYNKHDGKNNFGVSTAAISVFYLLALFFLLMFAKAMMIPGAFFICEIILAMLWLAAFVVLAKAHGQYSCGTQSSNGNISGIYYNPYLGEYTNKSYGRPCKSSQAAIAFAGLAFVLFCLSSFLFWWNIIRPIMRNNYRGGKDIWRSADANNVVVSRHSGLRMVSGPAFDAAGGGTTGVVEHGNVGGTDLENGAVGGDGRATRNTAGGVDEERYNTYQSSNNNSTLQSSSNQYNEKHERKPSSGTQPYSAAETNVIPEEDQREHIGSTTMEYTTPAPQNAHVRT